MMGLTPAFGTSLKAFSLQPEASFRNSDWLKLCIASAADQGVDAEHIIQDAGSDDGTLDWLLQDQRVQAFVEKDAGMYDAINCGFRRATGDILAWLNCDEQYLPNALASVVEFFESNPQIDVLFGDIVFADDRGLYAGHRIFKNNAFFGETSSLDAVFRKISG